ncbi:6-phosphogluconate dehydrogenase [Naegleria gruberi]|uniref:6-phosphogluconate dehydrogenase, decarboxylating n=1 Tax=Naegleria gruberi TaxID=5762 RepID=D2V361_NAEGR|nr:6-phosphogluconate dehydrogenase [Naegleria gruberi]EFC48720.1 6-phosphogluconate dehydrogenase [Naegleria gruberi]|eukprot:XP_002681464.1 6-phosphogluconate dehydrogenase [Naegleria gruberi strain NEG-M]
MADIGLIGLAVMGQNLALNIADKGFKISVYNRSYEKTEHTVKRAEDEGKGSYQLAGFKTMQEFVNSLSKPRKVIMLVQAGNPVDSTIELLSPLLEKGDIIIDGGNEWFLNTEKRAKKAVELGLLYMGMGVSGGEEGARHGPSLMPGGPIEAYDQIKHILEKIAAPLVNEPPCVTYIGERGSGNYVKMVHNGIEYGDMQLIAEVYDMMKSVGKLTNEEIAETFTEWNNSELKSYLIEITSKIFKKKDDLGEGHLVDKIVDKSGSKGTGKWTVQEGAERGIAIPTMASALDSRYISSLRDERLSAESQLTGPTPNDLTETVDKKVFVQQLKNALYCSKICSYTQGMNLIAEASKQYGWNLKLGEIARIWKGGCIIRAVFLDRIKNAYDLNPNLPSLFLDPDFNKEIAERQAAWRKIIQMAISAGIPTPALSSSLAYYDSYRRGRLPANLIQAQRDFFGAHTYERTDMKGAFHAKWEE